MENKEIAVRLLVIEHRLQDLESEVRLLFQDILDSIQADSVE